MFRKLSFDGNCSSSSSAVAIVFCFLFWIINYSFHPLIIGCCTRGERVALLFIFFCNKGENAVTIWGEKMRLCFELRRWHLIKQKIERVSEQKWSWSLKPFLLFLFWEFPCHDGHSTSGHSRTLRSRTQNKVLRTKISPLFFSTFQIEFFCFTSWFCSLPRVSLVCYLSMASFFIENSSSSSSGSRTTCDLFRTFLTFRSLFSRTSVIAPVLFLIIYSPRKQKVVNGWPVVNSASRDAF